MTQEKIATAIISAMDSLNNSIGAYGKKDEKQVAGFVWRAVAELEYALFLLSIQHQGEIETSSWKMPSHSKEVEIEPTLSSAQELLKEAKSNIEANNFHEAYKKTWTARNHLLKVQESLEKKK